MAGFRVQACVLIAIGLALYANTLRNGYAFDDGIVIVHNEYVQQGLRGIPRILSADAYASFSQQMGAGQQLAGGRYRPLSIVTFAVERQLFGTRPRLAHAVNVGLYLLSVVTLLFFLRTILIEPLPPGARGSPAAHAATRAAAACAAGGNPRAARSARARPPAPAFLAARGAGRARQDSARARSGSLAGGDDGSESSVQASPPSAGTRVGSSAFAPRIGGMGIGADLAFLTSLVFTIHPIHTEVVANLKSRDEILSFLFIILTCAWVYRYERARAETGPAGDPRRGAGQEPDRARRWRKRGALLGVLVFDALALLSKEYALTLLVLVPVLLYVFRGYSLRRSMVATLPLLAVTSVYGLVRLSLVAARRVASPDVLNDPFLFATPAQAWATKIAILGRYLKLLVFPHPLACDYSYKQIPYLSFADPGVWLSLLVHAGLVALGLWLLVRRHPLAFGLLFYGAHLALVSNLVVDIGATMGERLVYHSSLGFALVVSWLLVAALGPWSAPRSTDARASNAAAGSGTRALAMRRIALGAVLVPVLVFCAGTTIARNAVWRDDSTLFTHDVKVVPDSVLVNGNAGARYLELADMPANKDRQRDLVETAVVYLNKAVDLHPRYVNGYLSLGIAWFKLGDYENTRAAWGKAAALYPGHPYLKEYYPKLARALLEKGLVAARSGRFDEAAGALEMASEIDPHSAEIWSNLGGAAYSVKDYGRAREAWRRALALDPKRADAQKGLAALGER